MTRKHLTESQLQTVLKYLELIQSDDVESMKLGASLFYDDYKDKYIFYSFSISYYQLRSPENISNFFFSDINREKRYWIDVVTDLIKYGYYEQT